MSNGGKTLEGSPVFSPLFVARRLSSFLRLKSEILNLKSHCSLAAAKKEKFLDSPKCIMYKLYKNKTR